ncbi:hypothetical protein QYH69_08465 [Paraburkholderia sp. SARCC-3016]|jgi:hypothetical protein|uniref:hypothetical protein n=1 Tax=Paraburkholderia sp. SARCC-3016 TaxID=3058611 RepID=UPI002809DC1F|nr:hypothetical protein [Paraburkholderia sp. SARCC-3016]MDQ7977279.1 hypothetical protein [Paraburkholderia sp. SARCC-3016]
MTTIHDDASRIALRARMAESRAELLAARDAAKLAEARRQPVFTVSNARALAVSAPHVTLVAAILAGALVLGPRRIATVVVRNGLIGWIAKTVRRMAGR